MDAMEHEVERLRAIVAAQGPGSVDAIGQADEVIAGPVDDSGPYQFSLPTDPVFTPPDNLLMTGLSMPSSGSIATSQATPSRLPQAFDSFDRLRPPTNTAGTSSSRRVGLAHQQMTLSSNLQSRSVLPESQPKTARGYEWNERQRVSQAGADGTASLSIEPDGEGYLGEVAQYKIETSLN